MAQQSSGPHPVVRLAVALEGGLLVIALGVGLLVGVQPLGGARLTGSALAWGVVATIPTLLLMWWTSRSKWSPLRRLLREIEETIVPMFADCTLGELALIALLAGVAEEALFRGLVQRGISDAAGPLVGLLAASALFGLAHFVTHTYALLAGLLGLYLGALLIAADNIIVPIAVHTLYDFAALIFWVRKARGVDAGPVPTRPPAGAAPRPEEEGNTGPDGPTP